MAPPVKDKPYIYNPIFRATKKLEALLATEVRTHDTSWFSSYVVEPSRTETHHQKPWTKQEEQVMFLQYNYMRWIGDLRSASILQDRIAGANLGLICHTIKKYPPPIADDKNAYISECQAALCRAITRFDVRRDIKFSTYACASMFHATARLYRQFARDSERMMRTGSPDMFDKPVETPDRDEQVEYVRSILGKADLSEFERRIIHYRFFEERKYTLEEIGDILGCTKEWVRQVEAKILARLRESYENG